MCRGPCYCTLLEHKLLENVPRQIITYLSIIRGYGSNKSLTQLYISQNRSLLVMQRHCPALKYSGNHCHLMWGLKQNRILYNHVTDWFRWLHVVCSFFLFDRRGNNNIPYIALIWTISRNACLNGQLHLSLESR